MKKFLTTAVAAVTLAGAAAATATPAAAQHWHGGGYHGGYGGHYYRGHDNAGPAIAAGVLGLALGAAIASNGHSYSHSYYYDRPYYGGGYYDYDDYYPRICETTRWVWDPYIGRRVPVRERYRC